MARSTRASARRTVLAHTKAVKEILSVIQRWWTVPATVYVVDLEDARRNATYREREQGEYPEAQTHYWASTVTEVDKAIDELCRLRNFALAEFHKCEKEN